MSRSEQKVVQYLAEAHASEIALVRVLQSQIAMTPEGRFRDGLEAHLGQTREHARRIQRRSRELEQGRNPIAVVVGITESVVGQALALSKTPLDLLRGSGGDEKVLKNAKDAAATEQLEIATYTALETLATEVDDQATAKLAASIRADEERMLERIMDEIPALTKAVVGADVHGDPSYDVTRTGAADAARTVARTAKATAEVAADETADAARSTKAKAARTAKAGTTKAKTQARQARKIPGVAQAEGQIKGAVADEDDLAIKGYDDLNVTEIGAKLTSLSQIDLAKIDSYERRHEDRSTVTDRIETLRGDEPWPGYDEQNAAEITAALDDASEDVVKAVRSYEQAHKDRAGLLKATERELAASTTS